MTKKTSLRTKISVDDNDLNSTELWSVCYSSKNSDGRLNYDKIFIYYVSEKMFLKLLQSVDNETWWSG